ncbi:MAG: nucleotidyltransferase family protein [Clostridiales bacterium]|nr:nucleotidyltransferase family protein [Clostridiales bacterium]
MRVVGVIAEYNPFHLGHAHHLAQARCLSGADAVVAIMSSVFTQRGDAALLSPIDRARMALSAGADAVFALPAAWAVRDAEHFALGGVAIAAGLGCDALSFGTEVHELPRMQQAAQLLEAPDAAFSTAVQTRMQSGLPYPSAISAALEAALPGAGVLLESPNSTLGICYLRAMLHLGTSMAVVPVQRIGGYHDTRLQGGLPSATALRGAILRGNWPTVRAAMPQEAYRVLRAAAAQGRIHQPDALDTALLYRLRTMSAADYAALPDVSEGIEHRLAAAAGVAHSREALLQCAKTRRYPYARLSRLATHALLGLTDAFLRAEELPRAAWLLGFRRDNRALLTHLKEHATLPILGKAADADRSAPWFTAEARAYDLWALGAGLPAGLALTQGVTVV